MSPKRKIPFASFRRVDFSSITPRSSGTQPKRPATAAEAHTRGPECSTAAIDCSLFLGDGIRIGTIVRTVASALQRAIPSATSRRRRTTKQAFVDIPHKLRSRPATPISLAAREPQAPRTIYHHAPSSSRKTLAAVSPKHHLPSRTTPQPQGA